MNDVALSVLDLVPVRSGQTSAEAITQLRALGLTPVLLTGDNDRVARQVAGPKLSRATDPLYGIGTPGPVSVIPETGALPGLPGARTRTVCPRRRSSSVRSTTWACTPPGASKE